MTERMQNLSVAIATKTSRRRFLARSATGLFGTVATLAAGSLVDPKRAFAYSMLCESQTGQGCPYGCGPSRCCGNQSGGCLCGTGTNCANNGVDCFGKYGDWGGTSCWTCQWGYCQDNIAWSVTTTCCDCRTSSSCDSDHICISHKTTQTAVGCCADAPGPPVRFPKPIVVGVSTGDPATSWGDTSLAFPGARQPGPRPDIPQC